LGELATKVGCGGGAPTLLRVAIFARLVSSTNLLIKYPLESRTTVRSPRKPYQLSQLDIRLI
jgi:hypothetical protein